MKENIFIPEETIYKILHEYHITPTPKMISEINDYMRGFLNSLDMKTNKGAKDTPESNNQLTPEEQQIVQDIYNDPDFQQQMESFVVDLVDKAYHKAKMGDSING